MVRRAALLSAVTLGLVVGSASGDTFTFTVENVGVQPLSPVFVATHDATFDIFDEGAPASLQIEAIAEGGDTAPMVALAAGAAGVFDYAVGSGVLMPGQTGTVTVMADASHPYLSFAAMLGVTNDGFIGVAYGDSALDLFRLGPPMSYDFTVSYLDAWDAGTEINTESADDAPALGGMGSPAEGGVITRPHPGILGIADIPLSFDFYGQDIAHITVVPEPGTLVLLALGLPWLFRRR
jgi:hypothetical protein